MYALLLLALPAQSPEVARPDPLVQLPAFVDDALKPNPADSPLRVLQKERAAAVIAYLRTTDGVLRIGRWEASYYGDYIRTHRLFAGWLADLFDDSAVKLKCLALRLEGAQKYDAFVANGVAIGNQPPQDAFLARAELLAAEIAYLRAGGELPPPAPRPKERMFGPKVAKPAALDPLVVRCVELAADDSPVRRRQRERVRALVVYFQKSWEVIEIGRWDPSYFSAHLAAQGQLADGLLELVDSPEDRVKCNEMLLAAPREAERFATHRVATGTDGPQRMHVARAARLGAEIRYLKEVGTEAPPAPPPEKGKEVPAPPPGRAPKFDPWVAAAIEPRPTDTPLLRLQRERAREFAVCVAKSKEIIAIGRWDPAMASEFADASNQLWDVLADVFLLPENREECRRLRLAAARETEKFVDMRVKIGNQPPQDLHLARAERIDAEIDLLKFQESLRVVGCPAVVWCEPAARGRVAFRRR